MTLDQHGDQAMLAQGADQSIEGHGREMTDGRTPLQAEAAVRGNRASRATSVASGDSARQSAAGR